MTTSVFSWHKDEKNPIQLQARLWVWTPEKLQFGRGNTHTSQQHALNPRLRHEEAKNVGLKNHKNSLVVMRFPFVPFQPLVKRDSSPEASGDTDASPSQDSFHGPVRQCISPSSVLPKLDTPLSYGLDSSQPDALKSVQKESAVIVFHDYTMFSNLGYGASTFPTGMDFSGVDADTDIRE